MKKMCLSSHLSVTLWAIMGLHISCSIEFHPHSGARKPRIAVCSPPNQEYVLLIVLYKIDTNWSYVVSFLSPCQIHKVIVMLLLKRLHAASSSTQMTAVAL